MVIRFALYRRSESIPDDLGIELEIEEDDISICRRDDIGKWRRDRIMRFRRVVAV